MSKPCPFIAIPYLSVHPDRINLYTKIEWSQGKPSRERLSNLHNADNKHKDKISVNARRKMSKAVEYLIFLARDKQLPDSFHGRSLMFRLAFVTLTLPSKQIHPDNEIKESCLNQFLVEARRRWHVKNYVWRAEKQSNGNIHFHLLCDKFIPWSELRDVWNRIIEKKGYITTYRQNMKKFHSCGFRVREDLLKNWSLEKQIKAYQGGKKNDFNSPNSTDIHSLRRIKKCKEYIIAYVGKESQSKGLEGRMWGCNYELSDIKGGQAIADNFTKEEIDRIISLNKFKVYKKDHFTTIFVNIKQVLDVGCELLFALFSEFCALRFNYNIQKHVSFVT